jgi:protein-S-isoprenylcysteine O-methyltransferase Ste14
MTRPDSQHQKPLTATFWRTLQAVMWSFAGMRKGSASHEDMARLNPFHIIAVAIGLVVVMVVGLIFLVNWVATQPTTLS